MDKKKKLLATFFFFGFFLLLNAFFFIKPAMARPFRGCLIRRRQGRFSRRRVHQPARTKTSVKTAAKSRPSEVTQPRPKEVSGAGSNSGIKKGLTADEKAVRQSRHEHYRQWDPQWNGRREKLNPEKAARAASIRAKNLSQEAHRAYVDTQREDAKRYKKKELLVALGVIDPETGTRLTMTLGKENGRNVYNVKEDKANKFLHQLEAEARKAITLSPSGLEVIVGYGSDPSKPQWASNGYYPTTLREINVFAGFNRGDDHLIGAITPTQGSPSDLGRIARYPIYYNEVEDLVPFAQAKNPYTGIFRRPELAVLLEQGSLSQNAKLRIAKEMLADVRRPDQENLLRYGRIVSTSKQLMTINRIDHLDDRLERVYSVHGGRNDRGNLVYFGVEIDQHLLKPNQEALKKLTQPLADPSRPLASLEKLIEKPTLMPRPDWMDKYKKVMTFHERSWVYMKNLYKGHGIEITREGLAPYYEKGNFIFQQVKVLKPGEAPAIQVFQFDKAFYNLAR